MRADAAANRCRSREKLYGSGNSDLPQALAQALATVQLPEAAMKRMQVGVVELSDEVRTSLLPEMALPLQGTLANEFSKLLASQTGIGLLPPSMGEAIMVQCRCASMTSVSIR
jgi:hypothetical protein